MSDCIAKEIYKCGWCKENLLQNDIRNHPCMDLDGGYHKYVIHNGEVIPVDEHDNPQYVRRIQNVNCYYWEDDPSFNKEIEPDSPTVSTTASPEPPNSPTIPSDFNDEGIQSVDLQSTQDLTFISPSTVKLEYSVNKLKPSSNLILTIEEKTQRRREHYGAYNVQQLKLFLRERGAKVTARNKSEMIERLIYYENHSNFGYEKVEEATKRIETPAFEQYKDFNSATVLPLYKKDYLQHFLSYYDVEEQSGSTMYSTGLLLFVRCCKSGTSFFIKSKCRAEKKKHIQYEIDIRMSEEGEIEGSSCECIAGQSEEAHCKHVIALLLAIVDMSTKKTVKLEETCTQQLQNFHRPSKKFTGSPMKAEKFRRRTAALPKKKTSSFYNKEEYNNFFRNYLISNGYNSKMAIKQILKPAHLVAVELDHGCYAKESNSLFILKSFNLLHITKEEQTKIEIETRNQSRNKKWHLYRSCRLTASNFFQFCHRNEEGAKSLVKKILNPKPIKSKATQHGLIYENVAVEEFAEYYKIDQAKLKKTGLIISRERPYLGASPDRLLFEDYILEVKCPYSSRNQAINDITVPYLKKDPDNNLTLKENHPYYYQIQGQLYVTKRSQCVLLIYTFKQFYSSIIVRDEEFICKMLTKLDEFFVTHFKPALIEKYLYKNYSEIFNSKKK